MTDPTKPFDPATGNLDEIGPPPVVPETATQALSAETVAAFNARATEAAIRTDLRERALTILQQWGEPAVRKLLGLP